METLWEIADELLELAAHLDDESYDQDSLHAALNDLEHSLGDKVDNIANLIASWKASQAACAEEIARLQARKKTLQNREARLKNYLRFELERLNKPRLETETHVVSLRKGSLSVVVDDLDAVPDEYKRIKVEPDKTRLKHLLEEEGIKEFAHLERGPDSVVIK